MIRLLPPEPTREQLQARAASGYANLTTKSRKALQARVNAELAACVSLLRAENGR